MGARGASEIIFRREIQSAQDPQTVLLEKERQYAETFANPLIAAQQGYIDEVIDPAYTRRKIIRALDLTKNKSVHPSQRKHGNIPL